MLTQRQTQTIGLLTPQALSVIFSNPFFGAFSEGVALVAEENGYALHFISPVYGSLARALGRATVDGVVAIGLSDDHPEVEQIRRAGVPIVLVNSTALPEHGLDRDRRRRWRPGRAPSTSSGSAIATSLIIGAGAAGARRTPTRTASPADTFAGIGTPWPTVGRRVIGNETRRRRLREHRRRRRRTRELARRPCPTAVLAMSDAMAIGAMRALRDMGLNVPGDVSVVGFDDIDLAAARRSATDDRPSTDPTQGRGGGPPASRGDPEAGSRPRPSTGCSRRASSSGVDGTERHAAGFQPPTVSPGGRGRTPDERRR